MLVYQDRPLAILEVEELFNYDRRKMALVMLYTTDARHLSVRRFNELKDTFIGGQVTVVRDLSG